MSGVNSRSLPILAIFFFSGAAGLAYEIVWARQLSLTLGVSIYAVSATLVAFMGGLGAGAELSGRLLDKGWAPIRLYALCEASLGIYVLMFPLVWAGMDAIYLATHGGAEGATLYVTSLRFMLAVAVLVPPTIFMGATLPAIVRHMARLESPAQGSAGKVYAINTAGAMAGCVAAGFALIELFGLTDTLRIGAAVNILCAIGAWALAAEKKWQGESEQPEKVSTKKNIGQRDNLVLAMFAITGFCGLALELFWTRALILLLNNTTYAFSMVLSVFLLGTASGSALAARAGNKSREKGYLLFAFMLAMLGVLALFSLVALAHSRSMMAGLIQAPGFGWISGAIPGGAPMASALLFSLLVITPCTALLGACFPLAVAVFDPNPRYVGGEVGRLYAINIIGCVLGSLGGGYFMIPWLGVQNSVISVGMAAIIAGVTMAFARAPKGAVRMTLGVAIMTLPLAAYLFMRPNIAYSLSVEKLDAGAVVEFYEEGPSATALVSKNDSDLTAGRMPIRRLWINGDPIAGTFREALQLERLQAHIPLLLLDDPKNALVICFGTGSTAGAALAHGLESVIAVDISREVFNAGPWFVDGNLGVSHSSRFSMVEEDGRNYLKTTKKRFDFISTEPPPPSNAGIVSLYTSEFYELARDRLKPGGIVSQWIPIHHLSDRDLKSLVAAFTAVFPEGAMWYTKWDAIMIGSVGALPGYERLYKAFENPQVASSLADIGIYRVEQILANHMMGPEQLREYVAGVAPLQDDWPMVEFSAPRMHVGGVEVKGANLTAMLPHRHTPAIQGSEEGVAAMRRAFESQTEFFRGQVARSGGNNGVAAQYYEKALRMDQENTEARYALLSLNIETLFSSMATAPPHLVMGMIERTEKLDKRELFAVQLKFLRGILFSRSGEYYEAERALAQAVRMDPGYFMAMASLAGLYAGRPDKHDQALELYKQALALNPTEEERIALEKAIKDLIDERTGI
ncbi:MAG: fused MFS/spermidine synthase [Nitrospinota bacterium]|nr:fused MFS/spermidine synthase [Nitrospinota bacterium]